MKGWLKWVAKCGFEHTVKDNGIAKEYNFGNGVFVVKYYNANGGEVWRGNYKIPCGSNKQLIAELTEILAK